MIGDRLDVLKQLRDMAGNHLLFMFSCIPLNLSSKPSFVTRAKELRLHTSGIPFSRTRWCMHWCRSILHQSCTPSRVRVFFHRVFVGNTAPVAGVLVQRCHQGCSTIRGRAVAHSHVGRRGGEKRALLRNLFLARKSGRGSSRGRTLTGIIFLTHDGRTATAWGRSIKQQKVVVLDVW